MVYVEATVHTSRPVGEAYDRVTTWEHHRVPFTQIRRRPEGFVARTGIGPLGFDDPMRVVRADRPRCVQLVKEGRVVTGWAIIDVESDGEGSVVTWQEELSFLGVPDPLIAPAARWMVRRTLAQLLA
ncbi:SRPBCC family protein [Aeromicrobium phragmitis]|uniref:SRPBCC family protein n=1 Tax=Aeromicrobium phragmitis TaxID=2478914 RepID=A0A3L8PJS6_9ACTN|nr:SRPBCC family protein [Aeromicrobium phragmitis]RLV55597.1 SRPBCC family protein [Aeromicrobium phragmitis]